MEEINPKLNYYNLKKDDILLENNQIENLNPLMKNSKFLKEDLDVYKSFKKNQINKDYIQKKEIQMESTNLNKYKITDNNENFSSKLNLILN